ncbi:MAG: hypothetical protein AAGF57_06500 [Pseudomonadota bacterium]
MNTIQIISLAFSFLCFLVMLLSIWKMRGQGGFRMNMRDPQSPEGQRWALVFRIAVGLSIVASAFGHLN